MALIIIILALVIVLIITNIRIVKKKSKEIGLLRHRLERIKLPRNIMNIS